MSAQPIKIPNPKKNEIDLIYEKMLDAQLAFTWHEFNGQHAFMRDEGERYDPELALLGYDLALKLFQRKLA